MGPLQQTADRGRHLIKFYIRSCCARDGVSIIYGGSTKYLKLTILLTSQNNNGSSLPSHITNNLILEITGQQELSPDILRTLLY